MSKSHKIVAKACAGIPNETAANFAPLHHYKLNIRKQRKLTTGTDRLPQNEQKLRLITEHTTTEDGQIFILRHSGPDDDNRILLFGTESDLIILSKYSHWYLIRTF